MARAYIEELFWHMTHRPEAPAFTLDGATVTFGDVYARAQHYAAGLHEACDVQPGDRVLCRMQTGVEMIVALVGHYLLGVIHVPVNTRYGSVEMAHLIEDSDAKVVLVDDEQGLDILDELHAERALHALEVVVTSRGELAENREIPVSASYDFEALERAGASLDERALPSWHHLDAEQIALCIYTSGTTGKSKGVMLSYRAVVSGIEALTTHWQFVPQDRVVLALPLFHVHGLGIGIHGVLLKGCAGLLQRRFDVDAVVGAFLSEDATVFMGVPTMYARLVRRVEEDEDAANVLRRNARLFTSGSAALSADLFARFEDATGHRILERYGMSETLLTISNPFEPELRKPGTIGFPIASCEAMIINERGERCAPLEVGELVVRGTSLMHGYWRNEKATQEAMTADGWFLTGDAARYDEEGYIVHVGRQSVDILKVGGYKISAREIEEAIASCEGVEEVAIFGMPDAEWGERIVAAVVCARGGSCDVATLRAFLTPLLASYKIPREVHVIPVIPRNALGKVQKHCIKASLPPQREA